MTTATVVSTRPLIQITPITQVDQPLAPDRWLTLADDPFSIVARCTSLIPFSQTSKKAREKFYRSEYFRYINAPRIILTYGKISSKWPSPACISELIQKKKAMVAASANTAAFDPTDVTIHNLIEQEAVASKAADAVLIEFFDFLSQLNPSPLEARDAGSSFRNSLNGSSSIEKAIKIRAWFKEHGSHLRLTQPIWETLEIQAQAKFIPPELLEITSIPTESLSTLFSWACYRTNPAFVQAVIRSPRFQEITSSTLGAMLYEACQDQNWAIIFLLLRNGRCNEILNHENFCRNIHISIEKLYENNPKKCKLLFSCLSGNALRSIGVTATINGKVTNAAFLQDLLDNLSPAALQEAVMIACGGVENSWAPAFLNAVFNHPRFREIKTATLARGLFAAMGGETILRVGAATAAGYLATHADIFSDPIAGGTTAALAVGSVAGLTKERIKRAWDHFQYSRRWTLCNIPYEIAFTGKIAFQLLKKSFNK